MGFLTGITDTISNTLTDFVEHPSLDTFIDASTVGLKVIDNNIAPALNTLTNDIGNGIKGVGNDIKGGLKDVGNGLQDFIDTLGNTVGNTVGDLVGSLSSSLTMPLMILGGLGLAFLLLKPK